jgi:hypothetical protein
MSEHDDRLPMHQMLEHARDAVEMIRGRTRDVVWDTIIEDFPPLIAALEGILTGDPC